MKKLPQVLFILLVLLNSYFVESQQKTLQFIIEPLIVPTLFIYYWFTTPERKTTFIGIFLFLWMGNLFVLFENNSSFLKWGVFCYWMMLLFLSYHFLHYFKKYVLGAHLLGLLFYGSYLLVFLSHVYNSLGDMRIHGVIYGLTLSLLGSFTIMELLRKYTNAKALLTLGLLIFSVRDVLITYNKRYFEEDVFTYPIPILHALGFFMILKSFMWLEEINKENLNCNSDALE